MPGAHIALAHVLHAAPRTEDATNDSLYAVLQSDRGLMRDFLSHLTDISGVALGDALVSRENPDRNADGTDKRHDFALHVSGALRGVIETKVDSSLNPDQASDYLSHIEPGGVLFVVCRRSALAYTLADVVQQLGVPYPTGSSVYRITTGGKTVVVTSWDKVLVTNPAHPDLVVLSDAVEAVGDFAPFTRQEVSATRGARMWQLVQLNDLLLDEVSKRLRVDSMIHNTSVARVGKVDWSSRVLQVPFNKALVVVGLNLFMWDVVPAVEYAHPAYANMDPSPFWVSVIYDGNDNPMEGAETETRLLETVPVKRPLEVLTGQLQDRVLAKMVEQALDSLRLASATLRSAGVV